MNLQYLLPVKSENIVIYEGTQKLIDSKGLMAKLRVVSGTAYVTGEHDTVTSTSYNLNPGETIDFVGKLKAISASGGCTVRVLYFDAV